MLLENVKVKRPTTTKIQRKKDGNTYVYQVIEQTYYPDKKYAVDKRKMIGKMIDEVWMIPNEHFATYYPEEATEPEQPKFSDTLKVGMFSVIHKVMKQLEIDRMLESVFPKDALFIQDILSYILTRESCTFQYFQNFMRDHPVLDGLRDDTQISRLLKERIKEEDIELFMRGWNQLSKTDEKIYVAYDSTNMNSHAYGIEFVEYGHPKIEEGLPQFNLSYSIRQEDSRPLFYELYDGSVNDVTQLSVMLEMAQEYGYKGIGLLMDRGYMSKENIRRMRRKEFDYILMLKEDQPECKELLNEYGPLIKSLEGYYIEEHGVYGKTVKKEFCKREDYFHIFYDDVRASKERKALMEKCRTWEKELDKKVAKKLVPQKDVKKYKKYYRLKFDMNHYLIGYERKHRAIKKELDTLGFFYILSSQEMDAAKVLDIYRSRDNIEKMFTSLKSGIDYNKARVHTVESLKSKTFLTFIAMIIRNEIFIRMEDLRKKNRKEYTVPSMISILETIECSKGSDGQYRKRYALTAKQKSILKQFDITESDITKWIQTFQYE